MFLIEWIQEPITATMLITTATAVSWLLLKLLRACKRPSSYSIHTNDPLRAHVWERTKYIDKPTYCNVCEDVCIAGTQCQSCGTRLCTLSSCLKRGQTTHNCKPLSLPTSAHCPHFFVRGNLHLSSTCVVCQTPCGTLPKLSDFMCTWCDQTYHKDCLKEKERAAPCGLGPRKESIVPPNCVKLDEKGWKGRKRLVIKEITPPCSSSHWRPLMVLANPKSGGKDGEMIVSVFRRLLNPIQVIDLSRDPPEAGLELCRVCPHSDWRVLVCGGDGTVGWVLSAIDKSPLKSRPPVATLPLGTGNDLARVLGWGSGYENEDLETVIQDVHHAPVALLDRWSVCIDETKYLGLRHGHKQLTMNNYLGFGCGAGVALDFHHTRQSYPSLFSSRIINKAWYLGLGAKDVLQQSSKNIHEKIELYLDGVKHCLPHLEGVVISNINSWSAGCTVWTTPTEGEGQYKPCRMDDKHLEVVGIYSSLHVGRIQVGVDEPLKIGQAKEVKVVVHNSVPMQVDGEPWQQANRATITVTHQGQSAMLKKVHHEE